MDLSHIDCGWSDAYSKLYSKCNPTLIWWLRKTFGITAAQAEDVAATVHHAILNDPRGFDPRLPTAASFLFQRARYTALDFLKTHSRRREDPITPEHDNVSVNWPHSQQTTDDLLDFYKVLTNLKGRKQLSAVRQLLQAELEGLDDTVSLSARERARHAGLLFRARTTLRELMGLVYEKEQKPPQRSTLGGLLNGETNEKAY